MSLIIDLSPAVEERLNVAAREIGIAPAELVKKLVGEHLPPVAQVDKAAIRNPDPATESLFAQWAEEDEHITEAERVENDRIYTEIEQNGIPRVRI